MTKAFLSGNDAFAEGVRLARPRLFRFTPSPLRQQWLKDFQKWSRSAA